MGPSALCENETLSRIGVVDVQRLLFAIFNLPARPSAGISVVDVQKTVNLPDRRGRCAEAEGFSRFLPCAALCADRRGRCAETKICLACGFRLARATLCGGDSCGARVALCRDQRGRGAKSCFFVVAILAARATLCRDRRGACAKMWFVRVFLRCARATLCGHWRGRGAKACSALATICVDHACQIALAMIHLRSLRATVRREQAAKSQLLSAKVVREARPTAPQQSQRVDSETHRGTRRESRQ